jgi:hypothetical protein
LQASNRSQQKTFIVLLTLEEAHRGINKLSEELIIAPPRSTIVPTKQK